MANPKNEKAALAGGKSVDAKPQRSKPITKLDRIINLLLTRAEGLNRFEAEAFGDHCLNSTIAVIRDLYGERLIQRWETVPSRFTDSGVRCLRFWLVGGA